MVNGYIIGLLPRIIIIKRTAVITVGDARTLINSITFFCAVSTSEVCLHMGLFYCQKQRTSMISH